MPTVLRHLLMALCLCTSWAAAQAPSPDLVILNERNPAFEVQTDLHTWLDIHSTATPEEAALVAAGGRFSDQPAQTPYALTDGATLWVQLRLVGSMGSTTPWSLNIPLPYLDSATMYQRHGEQWVEQSAGDTLAHSQWGVPGLYPEFTLQNAPAAGQDVLLKVRNFKPTTVPIRLATHAERLRQQTLETLWLGLLLGALGGLAAVSIWRFSQHRDRADLLATAYVVSAGLCIAQINGLLNALLWPTWPVWGNYANSVLPMLTAGCTLLFIRSLYALCTNYHPRYHVFLRAMAWICMGSAITYLGADRALADTLCGVLLCVAACAGLVATIMGWRSGTPTGRWLVLGYVPQFAGLVYLAAESLNLVPSIWEMRYVNTIAVALSAPVLILSLHRITHDRQELEARANLLRTQDALTGLLTPEAFQTHVQSAYQRAVEDREHVALVMVNIINLGHIRESLGDTTAEQCLLRAVLKLHRVLRDVEPAGRVGTSRIAMVLEGVTSRQAVTERMVKLIASGLVPLQGLEPEVTLHFQVACVMLHENPIEPQQAMDELVELLQSMSPRTRRPIRFVEAVPTQAAGLQDSVLVP
jgi:two-component system, sensor histidine kinase LadS